MTLSLILLLLAAVLDAVQDTLKSSFATSVFAKLGNWWNPAQSWVNKWANDSETKERFFGSSTFLVWTTDAWHFFKMLMLTCLFCAIPLWTVPFTPLHLLESAALFAAVWGIAFEITYRLLNHKKL